MKFYVHKTTLKTARSLQVLTQNIGQKALKMNYPAMKKATIKTVDVDTRKNAYYFVWVMKKYRVIGALAMIIEKALPETHGYWMG